MKFTLLNKDDKRGVKWLERYRHKINWSTGNIPYKYVTEVITRDLIGKIYMKRYQRAQFLQSLGIYAENIEDMGIKFRIRDFKDGVTCKNHNNNNNYSNLTIKRLPVFLPEHLHLIKYSILTVFMSRQLPVSHL